MGDSIKTCNRVVVAAEKLDEKSAYVACSRGREQCVVHTPDKLQLFERLPEGNRKAALDVLSGLRNNEQRQMQTLSQRVEAWKMSCEKIVYRAVESVGAMVEKNTLAMREMFQRWQEHQRFTPRQEGKFDWTPKHAESVKQTNTYFQSQAPTQRQGMRISM